MEIIPFEQYTQDTKRVSIIDAIKRYNNGHYGSTSQLAGDIIGLMGYSYDIDTQHRHRSIKGNLDDAIVVDNIPITDGYVTKLMDFVSSLYAYD